MPAIYVTRNGQITLPKEIREKLDIHEGDEVMVNYLANTVLVTKRDREAWDRIKSSSLPKNFDIILKQMRSGTEKRLKKLGIIR